MWDRKHYGFTTDSKKIAFLTHNIFSEEDFTLDINKPGLPDVNGAITHRFAWADIRDSTKDYVEGEEDTKDFKRWTRRFVRAGEKKIKQTEREQEKTEKRLEKSKEKIEETQEELRQAKKRKVRDLDEEDEFDKRLVKLKKRRKRLTEREENLDDLLTRQKKNQKAFVSAREDMIDDEEDEDNVREFLKQANSFHANTGWVGPHQGVNNSIKEHGHLHVVERGRSRHKTKKKKRSFSPGSRALVRMSPERVSNIAVDRDDDIISITGETFSPDDLSDRDRKLFDQHGTFVIKNFTGKFDFG